MKDMDLLSLFCIRYPVFSATFVEEAIFSPLYAFGAFIKSQVSIAAWIYIWVFFSVPLVFLSGFVPVLCFFFFIATAL
jgi:hypothetical protein